MILSIKGITKALIRLRGCAGWSVPVLFPNPRRQVLSCRGPCSSVCTHVFMSQQVNIFTHLSWNQSKRSMCPLFVIQPSFFKQVQKQVNMTLAQGYKKNYAQLS